MPCKQRVSNRKIREERSRMALSIAERFVFAQNAIEEKENIS